MDMLLAYFDPGSASLLMQALVGGGAGLAVFGRYLWTSLTARQSAAVSQPVAWQESKGPLSGEITLMEALSGEFRVNVN
jgi:hypothetical protein